MDRSGSEYHTAILKRADEGEEGWVPSQGVGLGASVEPGAPQLLWHPDSLGCWLRD